MPDEPIMYRTNNGSKVVYGILTIVAVIGGLSAIVLPMSNSISDLRDSFKESKTALGATLSEHKAAKGHSPTTAALAGIREDFKEVETQFRAMRELFDSRFNDSKAHRDHIDTRVQDQSKIFRELEGLLLRADERLKSNTEQMRVTRSWIREHDLRIPGTDSAQWERIRALERQVYGAPQPVLEGRGK